MGAIGLFAFVQPAIASESAVQESIQDIYHFKPIYFLLGQPVTKVQFSAKIRVVRTENVYLGYTQLMIWELFHDSRPFTDINYNPELFYRWTMRDGKATGENEWLDFGPYNHESNGKEGLDSRSWNRVFLRYARSGPVGPRMKLGLSIQAWVPYSLESTNKDLVQYRGIYEINVTASNFLGRFFEDHDLNLRFYPGGKSNVNPLRGGRELTLRLKGNEKLFLTQILFQFFQGRGEAMLNYRENVVGFRAGIGI